MITYLWKITQMSRLTSDGFVITVYYNASATDGVYNSSKFGPVNYTQQPGEYFIPYEDLTEEIVVGWVQDTLGKDSVEADLGLQIADQLDPVEEYGVPWAP